MAIEINKHRDTEIASHIVWDYDGKCTMYFKLYACCTEQDPIKNVSYLDFTSKIVVVKKNPYHKGHSITQSWSIGTKVGDGWWFTDGAHGTYDDKGIFYKSETELASIRNLFVVHDSDGSKTTTVYYFAEGSETGPIGSKEAPKSVEITLPQIDRTADKPTISNISSTLNSASCDIRVPFDSTVNQYSTDGSNWTEWNKSVSEYRTFSHTWSGLNPNTTYTFYYRFRRDYNEVWSPTVSFTVKTKDKPPAPTRGTVSVSSKTYNSITYSWSGFSFGEGGTWGKYQYSYDNSSWVDAGQNTSHTRSNLSPNTNYTLYVRLVDNYGTASAVAYVTGTTDKLDAPTTGTVTVGNITESSAIFSWSGFGFANGTTWGYYRYSTDGSNWTSCGTDVVATLTGLLTNTSYTFYVQLVDNYGQASPSAYVTFKTKAIKDWKYGKYGVVYIKVNDKWKYGKLYYKKDGAWVYTNGNYIKY